MAKEDQDKAERRSFFSFLRWLSGDRTQAKFAERVGIDRSDCGKIERGKRTPRRTTLERILSRIGIPQRLFPFLQWLHRLLLRALAAGKADVPARPRSADELKSAVWEIVDRALETARAEHALLRQKPVRGQPYIPTEQDHQRVEALFAKLIRYSEATQQLLIRGARSYRDWLLCVRICQESKTQAANDPEPALKLAELALFIARHVDDAGAFQPRLESWCTGFVGNAQRASNDFGLAETSFFRAWRLWKEGKDPAGLLSEAYLLDMEASLRGDQRLFPQALRLHDSALAKARPGERGPLLLNKACTLQEKGDHEKALEVLGQAAQVIDHEEQPRLWFGVRFNQASNLQLLGRAKEAARILPEVQELSERLGNDHDTLRTRWLAGNVAAGLGRKEEAEEILEEVRRGWETRNLPFDFALASLDLALVYREQQRLAEIKALANEMVGIFNALGIDREALAAVVLFQEAAEKEKVTAELVKQVSDRLRRAQPGPGARFGGERDREGLSRAK